MAFGHVLVVLVTLAAGGEPAGGPDAVPASASSPATPAVDSSPTQQQDAKTYFGLPLAGRRIAFVVTRAGGMADINDGAHIELKKAIGHLSAEQQFHIVFWTSGPSEEKPGGMVAATPENKAAAAKFVDTITPVGANDPSAGLRAAFEFKPDVLYFVAYSEIGRDTARLVDKLNAERSSIVNVVHLVWSDDAPDAALMRKIASDNRGAYRQVSVDDVWAIAAKTVADFYRAQGEMTAPGPLAKLYADLPREPERLVTVVQGLLMHGGLCWLYKHEPQEAQQGGQRLRKIQDILSRIQSLDDRPLTVAREPGKRLLGNCRTFAVLLTSMLRQQGVPARTRAGFASYTWGGGKFENHWICEYWDAKDRRWVGVDAQIDDAQRKLMGIDFDTLDVPSGKFLTAGQAWHACRTSGKPEDYGLGSRKGWVALGWPMLRGTLITDLAALNKTEPLPGDESPLTVKEQSSLTEEELKLLDQAAYFSANPCSYFRSRLRWLAGQPSLRIAPSGANP